MELPAPEWLNKDFLTQCLQREEGKQNIVVTDFSTSSAVPPGNNYGSCLYRVKVEYKNEVVDSELHSLNLILKAEISEGPVKDFMDGLEFGESTFYYRFLPQARKLTDCSFAAKNFFSPLASVIVLEDLKTQGFVMADRRKQLDFEHCKLYAQASASLHAVSLAVHKRNPEVIEALGKEKMFRHGAGPAEMFKSTIYLGFKALSNVSERVPKWKKHVDILTRSSETLWDLIVEAHQPSKVINTINQGDPWTTNMMFKYDENGSVAQIKLVDFQVTRLGSPINDLVFFIWAGANHDVRSNRLHDLYRVYLNAFNTKLKELNCSERLSFEDLLTNVKKLTPLAVMIAFVTAPMTFDPEPIDMELLLSKDLKNTANPYTKYYNDDFCTNHLPKLIEQLELSGAFEYLEKRNAK